MSTLLDYPRIVLVVSFLLFWGAALLGAYFRKHAQPLDPDTRDDFGTVRRHLDSSRPSHRITFSMAVNRYDQRKNYEEAEANAIGTEFLRVELLPPNDAEKLQQMLKAYLKQRMLFYTTRDSQQHRDIDARTTALQNDLWSGVRDRVAAQPTPPVALVISGMNDVLNRRRSAGSLRYRIPVQACDPMALIASPAICSSVMARAAVIHFCC
jgi:hypothetical protein